MCQARAVGVSVLLMLLAYGASFRFLMSSGGVEVKKQFRQERWFAVFIIGVLMVDDFLQYIGGEGSLAPLFIHLIFLTAGLWLLDPRSGIVYRIPKERDEVLTVKSNAWLIIIAFVGLFGYVMTLARCT